MDASALHAAPRVPLRTQGDAAVPPLLHSLLALRCAGRGELLDEAGSLSGQAAERGRHRETRGCARASDGLEMQTGFRSSTLIGLKVAEAANRGLKDG
jgi:hypothetical protein